LNELQFKNIELEKQKDDTQKKVKEVRRLYDDKMA